jgi:hypothetical protein
VSARLFLALLAVVVSGCASGPKYSEIKDSIPPLDPEQGRIFFYRPSAVENCVYLFRSLSEKVTGITTQSA